MNTRRVIEAANAPPEQIKHAKTQALRLGTRENYRDGLSLGYSYADEDRHSHTPTNADERGPRSFGRPPRENGGVRLSERRTEA